MSKIKFQQIEGGDALVTQSQTALDNAATAQEAANNAATAAGNAATAAGNAATAAGNAATAAQNAQSAATDALSKATVYDVIETVTIAAGDTRIGTNSISALISTDRGGKAIGVKRVDVLENGVLVNPFNVATEEDTQMKNAEFTATLTNNISEGDVFTFRVMLQGWN